jgi:hypothetical protein
VLTTELATVIKFLTAIPMIMAMAIKFVIYLYVGSTAMAINKSDTNARRQQSQHQSRQEEKRITINLIT